MPATAPDARAIRHVSIVRAGKYHLAVDTALVEEAVAGPFTLTPFPRAPAMVLGAFTQRGTAIPMFDLAALLDGTDSFADGCSAPLAMVLRGPNGRFAVPVDALHGITAVSTGTLSEVTVQNDAVNRIFSSVFLSTAESQASVVLDVHALTRIDDLYAVLAPPYVAPVSDGQRRDARAHVIVRAGKAQFAIDADIVRLVERRDRQREMAFQHPVLRAFRRHGGMQLAVVDLLAVLGLDADGQESSDSHLVHVGDGTGAPIALIVDEVVAVTRIAARDIQPVHVEDPSMPPMYSGSALTARHGAALVLDGPRLVRAATVVDTSALFRERAAADAAVVERRARESFLVYRAGDGLLATPVSELAAVAELTDDFMDLRHGGSALVGLLALHGQSVQVMDLAQLIGRDRMSSVVGKRALVVRSEHGFQGFLVDNLEFICRVAPELIPRPSHRPHGLVDEFTEMIAVSEVGHDRTATVLHLKALAAHESLRAVRRDDADPASASETQTAA